MTQKVLAITILIVFVAIAIWFLMQKNNQNAEVLSSNSPVPTATPTVTLSPTPEASQQIKYDNGLIVQDVVVGTGKAAANGDTLSAHYVGKLENGQTFDNSYDRGQPIGFVLGAGQLIKGWELGLVGMKEGGKRKLVIPAVLGYGASGAGNLIPPNATLFFEIELVAVTKK